MAVADFKLDRVGIALKLDDDVEVFDTVEVRTDAKSGARQGADLGPMGTSRALFPA